MNKLKRVTQWLLAICALLLFIHLGSHSVQASEASVYKETLIEILSKSFDEDYEEYQDYLDHYYHVKFNKKTSNLYVNIKLPGRLGIYYYYVYWYAAIKAAQKAPLEYTDTFTFKDLTDKYTFNFNDIQALTFKKKFIRQWMQDNQPGNYDKHAINYEQYYYNYIEEVLFPKAINHVNYDDDDE